MNKAPAKHQPRSAAACREKGFTLLELMVVIVIIAILVSFATLTIRGNSPEDLIQEEASRLNRLLQLALEEAVLKNTEYGIKFGINSYQFLLYNYTAEQWQVIDNDKLLRKRELPHNMEMELTIEQIDVVTEESSESENEKKLEPQVFLLSSEEITPEFSVLFTIPGIAASYVVRGSVDGQHSVKASEL